MTRPLTPTELVVLRLSAEAEGAKAVAASLAISPATVRNHLTAVYLKLGVTSLVGAYRALGWLVVPD